MKTDDSFSSSKEFSMDGEEIGIKPEMIEAGMLVLSGSIFD